MSVIFASFRRPSPALVSSISFGAAVLLHGSLVVGALRLGTKAPRVVPKTMEIVALPSPAAPPPPPFEEPPPASAPARALRATTRKVASAAPPPPAAAARALTQIDDGQGPVDLTDSLVVGTAATYAGKTTAAKGISTRPGGSSPAPTTADGESDGNSGEINLSQPPRLGEGASWSCPFPPEADQRGIDEAVVRLVLQVDERGRVVEVAIEHDPGDGFGREAVICARSRTFRPGLDRRGLPVAGKTRVDVRFQR